MASNDNIQCKTFIFVYGKALPVPDSGKSNEINNSDSKKKCLVCKEPAHGYNFGALVCLPCKSFYIRCSKEDVIYSKCHGNCNIIGENRVSCQYCRYQQCLNVGMKPREKPERYLFAFNESLCMVCGDIANGIHFGVNSCEGCKKFFRRCLLESSKLICVNERRCRINPKTRNRCRLCRYLKCLQVGMSKSAVKIGRPRKTNSMPKLKIKPSCVNSTGENWQNNPLYDTKVNSSIHTAIDQWLPRFYNPEFTTNKSTSYRVSPSKEIHMSPPSSVIVQKSNLHKYTVCGENIHSKLLETNFEPSLSNLAKERYQPSLTQSLKSNRISSATSNRKVKDQEFECWPLPILRVNGGTPQHCLKGAIPSRETNDVSSYTNYQSINISEQLFPRLPSEDNSVPILQNTNEMTTIYQEQDRSSQIYTKPVIPIYGQFPEDRSHINPNNYLHAWEYSLSDDDDLLELLENSQKSRCESLIKSKSTSNIVSEANLNAQNGINSRTVWNSPEENLTQLYKSAEFLSLPNLNQLSSEPPSKPTEPCVDDSTELDFDSYDLSLDYFTAI